MNVYVMQINVSVKTDQSNIAAASTDGGKTVLQYQDIKVEGSPHLAHTMWDAGANRVLITHSFAKKANLKSQKAVFNLNTVCQTEREEGLMYDINVIDNYGKKHLMTAYGIEKIMAHDVGGVDLSSDICSPTCMRNTSIL